MTAGEGVEVGIGVALGVSVEAGTGVYVNVGRRMGVSESAGVRVARAVVAGAAPQPVRFRNMETSSSISADMGQLFFLPH